MEKEKDDQIPENAGVDKQWLKAILQGELEAPKIWKAKEVKLISASKPKSRIQEIIQQVYWDMRDLMKQVKYNEQEDTIEGPDEDHFDKWYENMGLDEYTQTYKLLQFLNTILRAVNKKEQDGYGTAAQVESALWEIADRVLEDEEYLGKVANVINESYPGLAAEFRSAPSTEELNELEQMEYSKEVTKITEGIESNVSQYTEHLLKIEQAKKTDFERIAQDLDKIVIFGESNWELILYSIMSPNAPRLIINALDYRANLHAILPGDISTAKSKIHKISKKIAPKMVVVDEVTKATFEGVAPTRSGDEIEEGLIDWAMDGVIIVEELRTSFTKMPLFRRVMDGEYIKIHKKGSSKGTYPNTTMLAACNPEEDFFLDETEFRKQITFKEGILSRFDVLIPLTATQVKNEIIVDKINLMSEKNPLAEIDLVAIKDNLATIAQGMGQITRIVMAKKQEQRLKDAFIRKNKVDRAQRILKNRPLVILRDLETLARLVNVITSVNFAKRKIKDGIIRALDEDIDKAIQLWENLIQFRIQLYAKHDRNIRSIADEIILYIMRKQQLNKNEGKEEEVPFKEALQEIVHIRRMIGESTFYREVKTLVDTGRVVQIGKRKRALRVVIR